MRSKIPDDVRKDLMRGRPSISVQVEITGKFDGTCSLIVGDEKPVEELPVMSANPSNTVAKFSIPSSTKASGLVKKEPVFTSDWAGLARDTWKRLVMPHVKEPLQWLEVGSFEGRSAIWVADQLITHPKSMITCVDNWKSHLGVNHDYEALFDSNIKDYPQISKIKGDSRDVLPLLPKRFFDVIYIDGSHQMEDVLADGKAAIDLLKPFGLLIFDDYLWPLGDGVKRAVDLLAEEWKDKTAIISSRYQVIFQLRTPSPPSYF